MGWNKVAVVGAGMIRFGELFAKTYQQMLEEAFLACVNNVDKGFDPEDIQACWFGACQPQLGIGSPSIGAGALVGNLALIGRPCYRVEGGCPTGQSAIQNAAMGVASGVFDVALVVGVEKMRESPTAYMLGLAMNGHPIYERGQTAMAGFAAQAVRHMHEYGSTKEHLAMIAVKNRYNGSLNPYSHFQTPITMEDVFNSPMVCWPYNILDCCPQTDGAAAVILCNADIASKYTDNPVYIAGFGWGTYYEYQQERETFVSMPPTVSACKQAYGMAGIGPNDIDFAEVHDCFDSQELMCYSDMGFCDYGEEGKLLENREVNIDGRIPINPSGGLMSDGHPLGATGVRQCVDVFWQLRGDSAKQNPKRQVKIKTGYGMQHNIGGRGIANCGVTIYHKPQ